MNKKLLNVSTLIGFAICVSACQTTSTESAVSSTAETMSSSTQVEQVKPVQYTFSEDFRITPLSNSGAESNVVLLTFDDAPDQYSLEIATILKEKGVSAIFFVNGHLMDEKGKTVVKQLADMGFEIGNHTQNHLFLTDLTAQEQEYEIIATSDLIEEVTGQRPRFFRPPFGAYNEQTEAIMVQQQMYLMTWTFGYDWVEEYQSAQALANITINAPELSNGANILMHDRKWTKEALAEIIDGLTARGYSIVDPATIQLPE